MRRVELDSDPDKIMQGSGETKSSREDGRDWLTAEHLLLKAGRASFGWLLNVPYTTSYVYNIYGRRHGGIRHSLFERDAGRKRVRRRAWRAWGPGAPGSYDWRR
jgi:hypothetical protein